MENLEKFGVSEMGAGELLTIDGGGFFYDLGYAAGYVVGQAENFIDWLTE